MNYKARQQAKVAALNLAHATLNTVRPQLADLFKPFIGSKVQLATGAFPIAIRQRLKEIFDAANVGKDDIEVIFDFSRYHISMRVRVRRQGDGITYYQEPYSFLLNTRNGILESIYEDVPRRTDWTVEEVLQKKKEFADLEGKLSVLKGELEPFARFDS